MMIVATNGPNFVRLILRKTFGSSYHPRSIFPKNSASTRDSHKCSRRPKRKSSSRKDKLSREPHSMNFNKSNQHPETSYVNQPNSWERLDRSFEKFPMPMTAPKAWQKHIVGSQTRGNVFKGKNPHKGRN